MKPEGSENVGVGNPPPFVPPAAPVMVSPPIVFPLTVLPLVVFPPFALPPLFPSVGPWPLSLGFSSGC